MPNLLLQRRATGGVPTLPERWSRAASRHHTIQRRPVRPQAGPDDTSLWVYREAPGRAKGLTVKEAVKAIEAGELKLVDIRAGYQRERAYVPGSVHVPLFIEDQRNDLTNFVRRQFFQFGNPMMALMDARMCVRNEFFMEDLAGAGLTKDQKLLMVCQEGLRSKMAADEVSKRGYNDVSYMLGGFSADIDGDFPVEGEYLLKNAAKGGAGRYLTPATVVGIASIFAAVFAGTVYAPEEAARVAVFLGL